MNSPLVVFRAGSSGHVRHVRAQSRDHQDSVGQADTGIDRFIQAKHQPRKAVVGNDPYLTLDRLGRVGAANTGAGKSQRQNECQQTAAAQRLTPRNAACRPVVQ